MRSPSSPRALRRAGAWLFVLFTCVALTSCGGRTDQRIGTILPGPPTDTPIKSLPDASADAMRSDASCSSEVLGIAPEEPPLAMYLLVDRSQYMRSAELRNDKWNSVIDFALSDYVVSDDASQLELGLAYYPIDTNNFHDGPCTCTMPRCGNCQNTHASCNPSQYGAAVEIAAPAQHRALRDSITMHSPAGGAPLALAWAASEDYLRKWQIDNPKKKVVRVLIAGGAPWTDGCGDSHPTDAVVAAAASRFRTYVISLDSSVTVLDQLATAGGTGRRAIFVDSQHDVHNDLFSAMQRIVKAEQGCDVLIPDTSLAENQHVDLTAVFPSDSDGDAGASSSLDPDAGAQRLLQAVETVPAMEKDRQHCPLGFWKYTDPSTPSRFSLCDNACIRLHQQGGQLSLSTECDNTGFTQ